MYSINVETSVSYIRSYDVYFLYGGLVYLMSSIFNDVFSLITLLSDSLMNHD